MAGSVNKVILVGNLTRDPEMRRTTGGAAVVEFTIATNEKYTDKSGHVIESVEFHNIIVWNGLAEVIANSLKKGALVYVEGRLKTRSWEDINRNRKYRTEIISDRVQFMDKMQGSSPNLNEEPNKNRHNEEKF